MQIIPMEVMRMQSNNYEIVKELFQEICADFGEASGMIIIKKIVDKWGDRRISVPGYKDLYRMERDKLIRTKFNGANHKELALMFKDPDTGLSLSVLQIRRILLRRKE